MKPDLLVAWIMFVLFILVGVGLILTRVDEQEGRRLESLNRILVGVRLYKHKLFRYGAALVCFIMAGVVYITFLSPGAE